MKLQLIGSIVIGAITGVIIPIYNGKDFSIINLIILISILVFWNFLFIEDY